MNKEHAKEKLALKNELEKITDLLSHISNKAADECCQGIVVLLNFHTSLIL